MDRVLNACGFPNLASVLDRSNLPIKIGLTSTTQFIIFMWGSDE